ncbi:MAG: hypothetical protein M1833_005739 [Piccolia ochrophora]|nr:MAG: hypothetical protein M1833_005739 [Piccolia ochrophora]
MSHSPTTPLQAVFPPEPQSTASPDSGLSTTTTASSIAPASPNLPTSPNSPSSPKASQRRRRPRPLSQTTGFFEPFSEDRNTTLAHPEALPSPTGIREIPLAAIGALEDDPTLPNPQSHAGTKLAHLKSQSQSYRQAHRHRNGETGKLKEDDGLPGIGEKGASQGTARESGDSGEDQSAREIGKEDKRGHKRERSFSESLMAKLRFR